MGRDARRKWIRRWWRESTVYPMGRERLGLLMRLTGGMRRGAARLRVLVATSLQHLDLSGRRRR